MASVNKGSSHFFLVSDFHVYVVCACVYMQACKSVDTCVWVHVHIHVHVEALMLTSRISFHWLSNSFIECMHGGGGEGVLPVKLRSYLWQLALETHVRAEITGRLPHPLNIYMDSGDANAGPQVYTEQSPPPQFYFSCSIFIPLSSEAYYIRWKFQFGTKHQIVDSLALFLTTAGKLFPHQ